MPAASALDREPLRILVGPTASGKSALALDLCEAAGAELVSLDSMQVYRGLDIGTAKPSAEERARVPHHMLDLVGPEEVYDIRRFLDGLEPVLADLYARGKRPLFVGGTGFYLAALLRGLFEGPAPDLELRAALEARAAEIGPDVLHTELAAVDPELAAKLHPADVRRVVRGLEVWQQTGRRLSDWQQEWQAQPGPRETNARIVGLAFPVEEQDRRIRLRTAQMLDGGWREEALAVRGGPGFGPGAAQALGYDTVLDWADGALTRDEAIDLIALRTRQFARRQRTWYRKFAVHWIPGEDPGRLAAARSHFGW
ncbi:MAG: tRNA (adenosine(37)-N6)-dimethylallyltransferase MiaA [Planctomycetota bacterium]